MTPDARKKLRELEMAATPGPWVAFNELPYRASLHEDVTGDKLGEIRRSRDLDANAAYIAAAHPGVMLELLDEAQAEARWQQCVRAMLVMAGFNPDLDPETAERAMKSFCDAAKELASAL